MSWFKKLLGRIHDEEEQHIEKEIPVEAATTSKRREQKEMDTRIVYQYPKGKFKFPLIPDEHISDRPPRKSREERKREPLQADTQVPVQPVMTKTSAKTVEVPKREPQPVKKQDYSKRPFRPTEIPSPVFGFEKRVRPAQEEVVEFELESFLEHDEFQQSVSEELAVTIEPLTAKADVIETEAEVIETELNPEVVHVAEKTDHFTYEKEQVQTSTDEEAVSQSVISEEVPEQERTTKQEPKRKHIPFNVLMLKEDRRHMEEKRKVQRAVEQPQRSLSHAVVEPDPRIETVVMKKEDNAVQRTELTNNAVNEEQPYYVFPSLDLLTPPVIYDTSSEWLEERERLLNDTLESFNVRASVVNVTQGPSVTRFEVQPEPGVKVNKITNLADDIKLSLAAKDIRIEAPIPGKHTIGIEVPNQVSRPVLVSEIINSPEFLHADSPLTAVLGLDISGRPIVTDLRKMPHGLIAGATGSGKSVCINTILVSLLYRARPDELKLLLIDPKMVELAPYNHIPHLVSPVITDVKAATAALKWAVEEMERRYELFAHTGVREINRFNELCESHNQLADKLPFIVIVIDELADLMMMAPADVEEAICRIAQKARACGIHLIIATQRPSVDVITGLIKANVPTRIAFSVSSQIDSRTIIDIAGAERLLGRGDMLFLENGSSKPVRLQGTFVSDEEIDQVVAHVRREQQPQYLFQQEELLRKAIITEEEDELFFEACEFIVDQGSASTSSLQRRFKVGYNRAARLIDMMEKKGFISENRGSKPRDVLIDMDDIQNLQEL